MKYIKHLVVAALMLLFFAIPSWAYDFEVDGICYTIRSSSAPYEVRVSYNSNNPYPGNVVIPESVEYEGIVYAVTSIGPGAFGGCASLTSIDIPNSVTAIWNRAFYGCEGLTSVTIGNSVTSIGDRAFGSCTGLTSIDLPNSVVDIGDWAFGYCTGLTSFDFPNSLMSIEDWSFFGCEALTSIGFPNSLTNIGKYALGTSGLTSIEIPSSITSIGVGAFCGSNITSIKVHPNNPVYDSRDNCNAIIKTDSVILVQGCTTTVIPPTVTSIAQRAFSGCFGLTAIHIPNSVTDIGISAFGYCDSLVSVTIGKSIMKIGLRAFISCEVLSSISIGESVKSIASDAFYDCSRLTDITIKAITPPVFEDGGYSFDLSYDDIRLHVPCGCREAYANAENWKYFSNIIDTELLYDLQIQSSDESLGLVHVIQQPADCDNNIATIVAEPIGDHPFLGWMVDDQVISTANPYTFALENDIELVAYFHGTGVDEEPSQQIQVFPNPANNTLNIECKNMQSIAIYTMNGHVLMTFEGLKTDAFSLDLTDLPRGELHPSRWDTKRSYC